ncbi:hypothetical protein SEA_TOMAS_259 [Streptomyces phage Tomas]|uniref:Uncharacterized protein n=1 Tax=Streptomyces phage Tomas TaxID=2914443 RepID=A0AA49BTF8_9CAUD|nr:hypothetical protein PP453_gp065 [Streptomyces phage Tomas]UMO76402.1 hypothetical protein SEA_TOMAS_259 [Streptomyces phage Tomas]
MCPVDLSYQQGGRGNPKPWMICSLINSTVCFSDYFDK